MVLDFDVGCVYFDVVVCFVVCILDDVCGID